MKYEYFLKNISTSDINLGDLRYKIPSGKVRNLLGKKSYITPEQILLSEKSGSISKRLGKTLIRVYRNKPLVPPPIEMADSSKICFPRRVKSSIIIDVKNLDEELKDIILEDEEDYLKQLQKEDSLNDDDVIRDE